MNNNLSILKIINGLSKTINIANKMLPLYNQIKPIIANGNKVINNINNYTSNLSQNKNINKSPPPASKPKQINNNLPTFFQ